MPGRDQTTRRGNQAKVLTTLLWGPQELISFTVSRLQIHNCATLTQQELSRWVLESILQTMISGPPYLHSSTSGSVWNKSMKGLSDRCPAGTEDVISQSVVSVAWKPNQSLQSPEHFYSQKRVGGSKRLKSRRKRTGMSSVGHDRPLSLQLYFN